MNIQKLCSVPLFTLLLPIFSDSEEMGRTRMLHMHELPGWIVWWFYLTAVICTIDASFIVFRPHTLPGGSLFHFFYPCKCNTACYWVYCYIHACKPCIPVNSTKQLGS